MQRLYFTFHAKYKEYTLYIRISQKIKRKTEKGTPKACLFAPFGRNLLPNFAFGKTGRTGAPQSAA